MINDDIYFCNINPEEDKIVSVQISLDENRGKTTRQFLNSVKFQYPDPKHLPMRLSEKTMSKFPIELRD